MRAHKKPEGEKPQSLPETTLQEITRRIVDVAQPEKIILLGSAAREEMGPNSDVDLLAVKSGAHRRKLAMGIYRNLSGVGCAVSGCFSQGERIKEALQNVQEAVALHLGDVGGGGPRGPSGEGWFIGRVPAGLTAE